MSDVLAVLEKQRQGLQSLREERVRSQERQAQLTVRMEEAEQQLAEMGVTSLEQVEALDREAEELAGEIETGLAQVGAELEEINGQGAAGGEL
jgi:predicted  nucleic acid-binding Zn-ribbon protein